jgi:hypothetical protein
LSPDDTLHFITYDSTARVVFQNGDLSEAGKEDLRATIDRVQASGQTNLFKGLELAVQTLAESQAAPAAASLTSQFWPASGKQGVDEKLASDGIVRRIFLFSDGNVNQGVTDPQQICRQVARWADAGITTGSFGIGLDFDEALMRGIAESGQGRYKFLATARDIPKVVSKSVHDLLDLYASEVKLDLRGSEHTIVSRVYGRDAEEDGETGDAPGLMNIGDLHNSNERLVLAELEVGPPGGTVEGTFFTAAEWVITGQRNGAPMQLSGEIKLQATRDRTILGNEASKVHTAFAIRRAADMDLEVADFLSREDRQRAKDVKSRQLALLREALEAAQTDAGAVPGDTEMLSIIIDRAQSVADQLDDEREDFEMVRRQCVQECELNRAMSCASFGDRSNSSASGGDIANLRDVDGSCLSAISSISSRSRSPRGSSPTSSQGSRTPPLSPRNGYPSSSRDSSNPPCILRNCSAGNSGSGSTHSSISAVPQPPSQSTTSSTLPMGFMKRIIPNLC